MNVTFRRLCALRRLAIAAALIAAVTPALAQQPFITREQEKHPFGSVAQEQRLIANICGTQMAALGMAGCACLAERAMGALDDQERGYLILSAVQPQAADRMEAAKSSAELKIIATFLDTAARECATVAGAAAAPVPAP